MKKNTGGFTLVEVIVAMAVSAIAMTMITGIIISSFNSFASGAKMNNAKAIGDEVYRFIGEQLTYATELRIFDNSISTTVPPQDKNAIWVGTEEGEQKGHLLFKKAGDDTAIDLYGEQFYNDYTLELNTRGYKENLVEVSLTVRNPDGDAVYRTGSTIELINLKLYDNFIKEADTEKPVNDGKTDIKKIPVLTKAMYVYTVKS
ncbi:MAG: prepilin-type N-terminal cleavage/methylation domain-containing protein [Hydrogenoanaerobacterium sp.]